ncbi:hypothetical protein BT93_L5140 [Corymbia citriodora subsp. variegata]|uniref:Uncharacterized protein n=1 Tax=Corymbia citriodora subsp. variegata TaxID=360336 RepID=A0A8T0CT34_CORYI|nr:hypothetical protein BT93_L5140 [Corymbia citriodora subsp. variegata]
MAYIKGLVMAMLMSALVLWATSAEAQAQQPDKISSCVVKCHLACDLSKVPHCLEECLKQCHPLQEAPTHCNLGCVLSTCIDLFPGMYDKTNVVYSS